MIDVVIIDDEVWVAKMITQIIDWGAYGFRIAGIFHDGEEGLDGIRRLHPRLVLTDIRMPGLTGLDLIQTLSEESPDIMFVIISGYNDFEYAKAALTYGAIGYLLKPIDETELKKVVLKAKKQLVSEELKQRSELQIRDTMGHTVEKLREQFFINFILGLGDRSIALNRVNEDLKLNFRVGSFQVVNLLLEQKNCSKICIDLITKAIWEVDLPTECCEMVTLNPRGDSILILNYTPEQKNAIQQILDRFFAVLLEKRPPCGITMGVGSVSGNFSDICVSYQSAHEIAMYRLLRGTNRVYSALKLPHTVSENTHTLDLNHDISLKQAFQSGDLEAVQKLTAQWIQWYFTKAQQAPQILIGGLNHLLSLYQENAPAGTRDWKAYFLERRDEIGAAAVMICLVDIYMFIRSVFKTMAELEHTLNVLEESAREDGTCYEESDGLMRQKTPTELLQDLLQREAAAQIMTKEAEINALQSQINPHFLYNTLETIRGQALCCGATSIADATKALAEIFRYNISQKGAMISLKEELANIDAYMRIQSIRFNDRFTLHSDVAEDTLYIQIPKLLVQPVIENALKHGLEVKRGKGNIWISAFRTANRLEIAVGDDGVGISPTILKALNEKLAQGQAERLGSSTTSNIGLANINERIKLIYGTDYGVTVLSAEQQGTRVILSLGILS